MKKIISNFKMRIIAIIIIFILTLYVVLTGNTSIDENVIENDKLVKSPMIDVDFGESNGLMLLKKFDIPFYQHPEAVRIKLELLRRNYETLKPSRVVSDMEPNIPYIIHFIWLGRDPMPRNYQYYIQTWRNFHPHWEIKIWTDHDIEEENLSNKDLYLSAESYAERSDIARYDILYKYGGLYVDVDTECLANFDELHKKYNFYANLEPPVVNKGTIQVVNSMIGSKPHNKLFLDGIQKIRDGWHNNTDLFLKYFATGPLKSGRTKHHLAVRRTLIPFSDAIFDSLLKGDFERNKFIILPIGYNVPFYPISDDYSYVVIKRPETMSIHHYDKSNSIISYVSFFKALFNIDILSKESSAVFRKQNNLYVNLQDLYRDNFPTNVEYYAKPQIPLKLYFYHSSMNNEIELKKIKWQQLNPFMKLNFIDEQDLDSFIPANLKNIDIDAKAFIVALFLVNTKGGVFVNENIKPISLQEFNFKYRFYGIINNINSTNDELNMVTDFVASDQNHAIISHVIKQIEKEVVNHKKMDLEKIKHIYLDNIYKFNRLDGKNIVFPANLLFSE